jgi:hypothetical protein
MRMKAIDRFAPPVKEFAHDRSTLHSHLQGTLAVFSPRGINQKVVRRCGLIRTGYSGDLIQLFLLNTTLQEQRTELRNIVGVPAEDLVYQFGTINRGVLCDMSTAIKNASPAKKPLSGPTTVDQHFGKVRRFRARCRSHSHHSRCRLSRSNG